jgi:colanic acid biosynthesis glycosyl transferase WcaI
MHILFLTENYPPETNAAANRVHERATYWVQWGHDVTVVTSAPNFPEGKLHKGYRNWFNRSSLEGVRVQRVPTYIHPNQGGIRRVIDQASYMVSATVAAAVCRPSPDVIVATTPQLLVGVAAAFASKVRRRPFILEISDLMSEQLNALEALRSKKALEAVRSIEAGVLRRADARVILSPAFRSHIEQVTGHTEDLNLILNGVDLQRSTPIPKDSTLLQQLGIPTGNLVVGYLGSIGPSQNLLQFLPVIERFGRTNTAVTFLLLGAGAQLHDLRKEISQRRIENVTVVDRQPKSEIPRYWSICDVALVHLADRPVFETVIPSKIFEAMAYGAPIFLVAPEGAASAFVEESAVGVWTRPTDRVAESLDQLLSDRALRQALSVTGRELAPKHSREAQARHFLRVLETTTATYYTRKRSAT